MQVTCLRISKNIFVCAVDFQQRKCLQKRHRSVLDRTKLLAAVRPQLIAPLGSGSVSVLGASPTRVYESPPIEVDGGLEFTAHGTITGREHPVCYPWDWVSPQLLNRKGEEIYYPDTDRSWARRLE